MTSIFSTTENFLHSECKTPWDKIVTNHNKQVMWRNFWGIYYEGLCGKTTSTFKNNMMLFLKMMFMNNAAEDMKIYMTCLEKPNKMKVQSLLQQTVTMQQRQQRWLSLMTILSMH